MSIQLTITPTTRAACSESSSTCKASAQHPIALVSYYGSARRTFQNGSGVQKLDSTSVCRPSVYPSVLSIYKQSVYLKFGCRYSVDLRHSRRYFSHVSNGTYCRATSPPGNKRARPKTDTGLPFDGLLYSERTDLTIGHSESDLQPKDDHQDVSKIPREW